jgi:hypothetical protein
MGENSPGGKDSSDPGRKGSGGVRVPSWVMFPVGATVGYLVAGWPGAIFGGVIGFFLWRSRA